MPYYTELHAHTSEVSPCAHLTAAQVADRYLAAGYRTVVVTNHYCDYVMDRAGEDWEDRFRFYLSGYRAMRDYAGSRLCVLPGLELRFTESANDYLVFGADEEFLYEHPNLHLMTLKTFSGLAREHDLLLIQAHPLRNRMQVMQPALLDGYEVFNAHPGHDARNDLARLLCRKYGKIPTSGSDFHDDSSAIGGGLITAEPILSMEQLCEVLRSRSYILHCAGPAALRDGMGDIPADGL